MYLEIAADGKHGSQSKLIIFPPRVLDLGSQTTVRNITERRFKNEHPVCQNLRLFEAIHQLQVRNIENTF